MNKYLKILIIILNLVTLWVSYNWYKEAGGHEPSIAIVSQIIALLTLFSEKLITKNIVTNVKSSKIDLQAKTNTTNTIKNIEDADIKIKND